ncbi:MAG: hypothetical protein HOL98_08205 [Gammaproteobacteria bacterium]|jgi:hypothetical protein|nr:hypothetical protein [Gammaproteobacteria bacterium]MBT5203422.1 hypothetical protein [Gammaproteobacteria bacterium]MBT5602656.1 hypothetical protein [Gammaproteobacteria bacterium]MBT6245645.1 hypothetical protein [Gammaproteobacteria bacterium]
METITRIIGRQTAVAGIHFALPGGRALLDTDMNPSWRREAGMKLFKIPRFNISSPAGRFTPALKAVESASSVVKSIMLGLDSVFLLHSSAWLRQQERVYRASLRSAKML